MPCGAFRSSTWETFEPPLMEVVDEKTAPWLGQMFSALVFGKILRPPTPTPVSSFRGSSVAFFFRKCSPTMTQEFRFKKNDAKNDHRKWATNVVAASPVWVFIKVSEFSDLEPGIS